MKYCKSAIAFITIMLSALPARSADREKGMDSTYIDLRTNVLYDILALPNIGVEYYAGKNITVGASVMYGWWSRNSRHRYWRAYGGEINARCWFGNGAAIKPLAGHHAGILAGVYIYDFEFGGKGQLGGAPGKPIWHNPSFMAGVEYGYSLALTRRLNIDLTAGFGYFGGKHYEYEPIDGHYVWSGTRRRTWWGPIKLEVSLVWLIGRCNFNKEKRR